jgi:competence protein ComEC
MGINKITLSSVHLWFQQQLEKNHSRWFYWTPVALASGISLYFSLLWHPSPAWLLLPVLLVMILYFTQYKPLGLVRFMMISGLIISIGFSACIVRDLVVAAPVLQNKQVVMLTGTILQKSPGTNSRRIVLGNLDFENSEIIPRMKSIRLTVRTSIPNLKPGDIVKVKVVLLPPPAPAYPGGYDFQRHAYFQSIGAVGYNIGDFEKVGEVSGILATVYRISAVVRNSFAAQVSKLAPPESVGFITAISTGDKGAIPPNQLEDMRHSGLAHLLAISGLHMGMIGGLLFFFSRFLLVLWPYMALNYPIKKIAAVFALIGLMGYLFVSGMSISAIRAYIMISAMFLAICFDRTALSFRMVVIAATIILLLFPESLTTASFQMSFAAVFALISFYELIGRKLGKFSRSGGLPRKVFAYVLGIILTSLIAGLATAPFAIYHFGQFATYSLIANLIAVPIMGLWVMPWAIIAFLLYPFDLSLPFQMMGAGIECILWIASETARWPYAVYFLGTYSTLKMILISLFSMWFMIWKTEIRWLAIPVIAGLVFFYLPSLSPKILVSGSGNLFAIETGNRGLYLSSRRIEKFEAERW